MKARHAGVLGEVIEVVRARESVEGLDGTEAAIAAFGRKLFGERRASLETWARFSSFFERRMLANLACLRGAYAMTAAVAVDVQPPKNVPPSLPSRK